MFRHDLLARRRKRSTRVFLRALSFSRANVEDADGLQVCDGATSKSFIVRGAGVILTVRPTLPPDEYSIVPIGIRRPTTQIACLPIRFPLGIVGVNARRARIPRHIVSGPRPSPPRSLVAALDGVAGNTCTGCL